MSDWIRHCGTRCPVSPGVVIEVEYRSGRRGGGVMQEKWTNPSGYYYRTGKHTLNAWFWAVNGRSPHDSGTDVVAYRIVDDGAEAETKRRAARMDTFRKMADAVTPNAPDPKLPAPKKRESV